MNTQVKLLSELERVLAILDALPASEVAAGWDEPRARNWAEVFSRLHDAVGSGAPLKPDYDGVVFARGLDMDGICSGEIFDAAVTIGPLVRELCAQEK